VALVADLAAEFSWPHDFWRRMGWRELNAWAAEVGRRREAEAEAQRRAQQRAEQQRQAQAMRGGR